MKTIILSLLIALTLTGCLDIYDRNTKAYLERSRTFNAQYNANNPAPYKYQPQDIIQGKDTADIFRCPAYTLNTGYADCDGFAYLSLLTETKPFAFFVMLQFKYGGHVVAFYNETPTTYTVHTNEFIIPNQTLDGYIATYYPETVYIALIDRNLNLISTKEID